MSRASCRSLGGGSGGAGEPQADIATARPKVNVDSLIELSLSLRFTEEHNGSQGKSNANGERMNSTRLEAFSDGVIAIIITIMVLELKVPHGETADALEPLIPNFLSYVLSFIYVGIYWNNHHHMLHTVEKVSGRILWANLHLLFWLSLFPITTAWIGENHLAAMPSALYGVVLLMASLAYWILQQLIIASQGPDSLLKRAIGGDWKGKASPVLYSIGIAAAFRSPPLAQGLYLLVALMWFVPDRRIASVLVHK